MSESYGEFEASQRESFDDYEQREADLESRVQQLVRDLYMAEARLALIRRSVDGLEHARVVEGFETCDIGPVVDTLTQILDGEMT
jgi:hypothetical protein